MIAILQVVAIVCLALGAVGFAAVMPSPLTWVRREWWLWKLRRDLERHAASKKVGEVTRRIRK